MRAPVSAAGPASVVYRRPGVTQASAALPLTECWPLLFFSRHEPRRHLLLSRPQGRQRRRPDGKHGQLPGMAAVDAQCALPAGKNVFRARMTLSHQPRHAHPRLASRSLLHFTETVQDSRARQPPR